MQTVEDENVPLELQRLGEDGNVLSGEDKDGGEEKKLQKIDNEEVPLADIEAEQNHMSWWWLLIVLLLGATGAEMYRIHQKKLEESDAEE